MNYPWHMELPQDMALRLKTDLSKGLSQTEVKRRQNEFGLNIIAKQKQSSVLKIFLQQLNSLVVWVLLGAVAVSFYLHEETDAIVIFAIVILNIMIGFILEYRADQAVIELQKLTNPSSTVLRDNQVQIVPSSQIVPGDILILEAGDLVAADSLLFETALLKINEAVLTGESLPIEKNTMLCSLETPMAERKNMVFMGTSIVNGTARAIVVATGMSTEMGQIAELLTEASRSETPLQKRLDQVGNRLLWVCGLIILLILIVGVFRSLPFFKLFLMAVSLAVAAIPEGLPTIVTIALALGVQRMARRSVLIKRMSAVETLGCLQVICTDKTGTLTIGEMTVRQIVTSENSYTLQGEKYGLLKQLDAHHQNLVMTDDVLFRALVNASVLCNNASLALDQGHIANVGDPTEIALLAAGVKANILRENLAINYQRMEEVPFDSKRKLMTVIYQQKKQFLAFTKGAPEIVLERCSSILTYNGIRPMNKNDYVRMQQTYEHMASEGSRVLAVAQSCLASSLEDINDHIELQLIFIGFIGLQDPPHADARKSVLACKAAGIKPVMITGDHPATARAIAQELDIFNSGDRLLTGLELENMTQKEFVSNVKNISVYARVTAEDKLRIVRAWKEHQAIVAMTGDGVNDAPALKEASLGIAMGKTGSSVTKEVADMVVLDNSFTSIIAGIAEGRTIYDNISKTLAYLLAGNSGELMVVFFALLSGWPLPLLPIQLLWINLITDGLPAICLATDAPEPGILKRQPKPSNHPFMDAHFFRKIILVGLLTSIVTLGVFAFEYFSHEDLLKARDAAFSVLVTAELLRAFGARNDKKTIFQIGVFSNIRLVAIVIFSFLLQFLIHYIPIFHQVFAVTSTSITEFILWIGLGSLPFLFLETYKLYKN